MFEVVCLKLKLISHNFVLFYQYKVKVITLAGNNFKLCNNVVTKKNVTDY